MREIWLNNIGTNIYMENYGDQEEEERIKLYDSDHKYLDYFSVERLEDAAKSLRLHIKDILDAYVIKMREKENVQALLDWIGVSWEAIYENAEKASSGERLPKNELSTNEFVNRIGAYYIAIKE